MKKGILVAAGLALTVVGGTAQAQVAPGGRAFFINGQFVRFVPGQGFVPAAQTQAQINDPFALAARDQVLLQQQQQQLRLQHLQQQRLAAQQGVQDPRALAQRARLQQQALAAQRQAQFRADVLRFRNQVATSGAPVAVFNNFRNPAVPITDTIGAAAFPTAALTPNNMAAFPMTNISQAQAQALAQRGLVPANGFGFGVNPGAVVGVRGLVGPGPAAAAVRTGTFANPFIAGGVPMHVTLGGGSFTRSAVGVNSGFIGTRANPTRSLAGTRSFVTSGTPVGVAGR